MTKCDHVEEQVWQSYLSWEQRQAPSQAPASFCHRRHPLTRGCPSSAGAAWNTTGDTLSWDPGATFHLLSWSYRLLDSHYTLPGTFLEALEIITTFWAVASDPAYSSQFCLFFLLTYSSGFLHSRSGSKICLQYRSIKNAHICQEKEIC